MKPTSSCSLSVLAGLALLTPALAGDIVYQGKKAAVRVGPGGVEVLAPGVRVEVRPHLLRPAPVVQPPEGVPLQIAPPAPPVPLPGATRPPTIDEFVAGFKPTGGHFEVTLLHPFTNCPTKVCFALPPGCPKKVKVGGCLRRCIEFDYGKKEIEIWFYRDGRVKVNN